MQTIAIANQKGGVAKTTTAINLAAGLTLKHKRVLLIDLDPQANATEALPIEVDDLDSASVHEVLAQEKGVDEVVQRLSDLFFLVPSHIKLARLEPSLIGPVDAYRLKDALELSSSNYDYAIIDCPPSLGPLTTSALIAASAIIVPVKPAFFGLSAVHDFMETVAQVKTRLNPDLRVLGILITLYDARTSMAKDVSRELAVLYGELLFETRVGVNVQLDEAVSARQSIYHYAPQSSGAQSYRAVVEEVMRRGN